jgi:large subunit ribosomal protein L30
MAAEQSLRITQRKSASGASPRQRDTLRSLGLTGIGRSVERPDRPELRGMIRAVSHLVEVSGANGAARTGGERG